MYAIRSYYAFVVVKAEVNSIGEQTLKEASEFAASFSRAWRENAGSVDVYWVKVDQLSKSGPSGESVPHGAFFVVGKRNWYRNTPLRVAVGVVVGEKTRITSYNVCYTKLLRYLFGKSHPWI